MKSKTTISGIVTAISSFLALVAIAPPELQNQIPQLFPESYRGTIVLLFGIIASISRVYGAHHTADSPPNQKENTVNTTPLNK